MLTWIVKASVLWVFQKKGGLTLHPLHLYSLNCGAVFQKPPLPFILVLAPEMPCAVGWTVHSFWICIGLGSNPNPITF